MHRLRITLCSGLLGRFIILFGLSAAACVSEPERGAHEPSVATRHTSIAPATASMDAQLVVRSDPAQAFQPPALLRLPSTLQSGERVPLLLILHGFGVSSALLVAKAGLERVADQKKFAYLAPEGERDGLGRPYWNAGASCCDLEHKQIDDVKRLRELLDANLGNAAIDPKRVFLIGYSNGGFMAQRLACEVGDRIAGLVSVAGAAPSPDQPCAQSTALAFLEIHGDADPVVHYAGGTVYDRTDTVPHASAPDTAQYWARQLSCAGPLHDVAALDLELELPDRETVVQRYDDCRGDVELWTVKGGGHYIALQPAALDAIWSFVLAHPKAGN